MRIGGHAAADQPDSDAVITALAALRHAAADQPDSDAVITALAARQHGVVSRTQLLESNVPVHAIDYRVEKGRLDRLYRGVYRVGPLRARYERELAAVLACGPTAVLSHHSAAALWKLLPYPADDVRVDVTLQRGYRAPGSAVRVHRVARLCTDETTSLEGMRVTVAARTLLDLAGSAREREVEQALARADRHGLVDGEQVARLLQRYPRRSGTRLLRALLGREAGPALTRSEAETRFLVLVRRGQLAAPEANVVVKGYELDFLWRASRLVVEIDGFAFHSSSSAFERDRRRDAVLAAAGFRVMRVTWRQLSKEPEALLVRLAQALAKTGAG